MTTLFVSRNSSRLTILGMVLLGALVGFGFIYAQSKMFTGYSTEGTYPEYSLKERIELADVIFEGRVLAITPAQFNQENGEFWKSSNNSRLVYPYHTIEISVENAIKDKVGVGKTLTITQVGNSPLGNRFGLAIGILGHPEHSLQIDDAKVFMIRQMSFPWREKDNYIVWGFVGHADHSYLSKDSNGLWQTWDKNYAPISSAEFIKMIDDTK